MRYALGRMSTAPGDVADAIRSEWPQIAPNVREMMQEELTSEIERDGSSRARPRAWVHPLGHDCDRDTWVELLGWMRRDGGGE
jgi:hypothetical protein